MAEILSPSEVQKAIDYLLNMTVADLNSEELFSTCLKLYNSTKYKNLQEHSIRTEMSTSFGRICEAFSKFWKFKKECPIDLTKPTDRKSQLYRLIMRMVWNTTDLFENICTDFLDRSILNLFAEDFSNPVFLERVNSSDKNGDLIFDFIQGYIHTCLNVVKRPTLEMKFLNNARAAKIISSLKDYTASKYAYT